MSWAIAAPLLGGAIGGLLGKDAAKDAATRNADMQDMYARSGIQMRVEDAKKAGIHPLHALGASVPSFSPIHVGDNSLGQAVSNMGQDIGNAVYRAQDKSSQAQTIADLSVKRAGLENQLLEAQIAKLKAVSAPGLPSNSGLPGSLTNSGQGDAYVLEQPLMRTHSAPGLPHQEVGTIPDVGWTQTKTGLVPVPSSDVKQRIEDQMIPEAAWGIRNYLQPFVGNESPPHKDLLPKGATHWKWNSNFQEYQPQFPRSSSKDFGDWFSVEKNDPTKGSWKR